MSLKLSTMLSVSSTVFDMYPKSTVCPRSHDPFYIVSYNINVQKYLHNSTDTTSQYKFSYLVSIFSYTFSFFSKRDRF